MPVKTNRQISKGGNEESHEEGKAVNEDEARNVAKDNEMVDGDVIGVEEAQSPQEIAEQGTIYTGMLSQGVFIPHTLSIHIFHALLYFFCYCHSEIIKGYFLPSWVSWEKICMCTSFTKILTNYT